MALRAVALVASALGLTMITLAISHRDDALIYNHSRSMAPGFYVRTNSPIARGAIVTIRALDAAPLEAVRRGFDDPGDRFLKRVAAIGGDTVCGREERVTINGRIAATRRRFDSQGRSLVAWQGCHVLGEHELLLLGDGPESFDGRYFGTVDRRDIEGVWRAL